MKALAPNTMIQNRYLAVHLIGKGGMGDVYLAIDQRLGSAVALKRTFFADDEMLGGAFEREAKILARLRHPALPKVSDHFLENSDQYLVMEHISGDDLAKRLESSGKAFPMSWVMFWADQLLDALSYLHSHEPPIIHRDIKPQNLKLTDDNHIVLLDFGLSKESGKTQFSKPGTSGSVVGYTPHFASMEQIRGTGTGPRSDIYSLSATLYQLLTNTMTADALTRADALLNGNPDPIVPPSDLNPEVSPAVSNVILKGLEVSSEKRFASAAEMQRALRTAHSQITGAVSVETKVERGDVHMTVPPQSDPTTPIAPSEMETRVPTIPPRQAAVEKESILEDTQPPIKASEPVEPVDNRDSELVTKAAAAAASSARPVATTQKKKSGSWLPLVIVGMAGILLLGGAAIGGGYYFYSRSAAVESENPAASPSPIASPSVIPESAAVPAELPGTTETSPANANSVDPFADPAASPAAANQQPRDAATRPKAPASKATPKPKPLDDRTILLQ